MRNGLHLTAGILLVGRHEIPEIFNVFRIESGERQNSLGNGFIVFEHDNPMQIVAARLARPFITNERGELPRIVIFFCKRHHDFPGVFEHIALNFCLGPFCHLLHQQIERIHALTGFHHVMQFLAKWICKQRRIGGFDRLRQSEVFCMVSDHQKIQRSL